MYGLITEAVLCIVWGGIQNGQWLVEWDKSSFVILIHCYAFRTPVKMVDLKQTVFQAWLT